MKLNNDKVEIDDEIKSQVTISSSDDEPYLANVAYKKPNNSGRWSKEENFLFFQGLEKFGNDWKKIQENIKTRTTTQARSHAQKIFLKIKSRNFICIPNKITTLQELFKRIKSFPQDEYKKFFHHLQYICNEERRKKNSPRAKKALQIEKTAGKRREEGKKTYEFKVYIPNNSNFDDEINQTIYSSSPTKRGLDQCVEEFQNENRIAQPVLDEIRNDGAAYTEFFQNFL